MPRPRPQFLHRERSRHGKMVWYVRVGRGARTRIRAEYGSPEFRLEYEAAIAGEPPIVAGKAQGGSLAWLVAKYRSESESWPALSKATRRQRDNIFSGVLALSGTAPYRSITKAEIAAGRARRKETPAQARNFLDAMRGLFRWALNADLVKVDPTVGVDNPPRKAGSGFAAWAEDDVAIYYRRWPLGTKERVWLDLLLYTGLRRSDAVKLGLGHVREGVAVIKTKKSGETVTVWIPILPVLQKTLDAGPTGDIVFIVGQRGRPMTPESFGNAFSEAAALAGVPKSAHGVRKLAATRAANNGATVAQLEALFGWRGGGMASLYTRDADRSRLAREAITMLNKGGTPIPAPENMTPAPSPRAVIE